MRKFIAITLLALSVYACSQMKKDPGTGDASPYPAIPARFCYDTTNSNPCSTIPVDMTQSFGFGYKSELLPNIQPYFENTGWQTFIALNWPAGADGKPIGNSISDFPDSARVWEKYTDPESLFPSNSNGELLIQLTSTEKSGGKFLHRDAKSPKRFNDADGLIEADGNPLIDRNLNFVIYEVRINNTEKDFIVNNRLVTSAAIDSFFNKNNRRFHFPASSVDSNTIGSIEIKAAWRILDKSKGDDTTRFFTRRALIYVPASSSTTNKSYTFSATVGLVGMHIIHKTGIFNRWLWHTFEHIDNTPDNLIEAHANPGKKWSFYNPACLNCPVNKAPDTIAGDGGNFRWSPQAPRGKRYAYNQPIQIVTDSIFGTQVMRHYPIYGPTELMNRQWQAKLSGTVWANYRIIGTQWAVDDNPSTPPNAPTYLGNTTLETYIQPTASCMTCHGNGAYMTVKNVFKPNLIDTIRTDFSFLLPFYAQ